MAATHDVATTLGPARLHADGQGGVTLVLGHGAGGGVHAPDLLAVTEAALSVGLTVVRVEQPWRVAGRQVAGPKGQLDQAWLEVCAGLPGPLIVGGRSAGARVACRTATRVGARAVLCLAFPLRPPAGGVSRAHELALPVVPVLVVQGGRDRFGVPDGAAVVAAADHQFAVRRADLRTAAQVHHDIVRLVTPWLAAALG